MKLLNKHWSRISSVKGNGHVLWSSPHFWFLGGVCIYSGFHTLAQSSLCIISEWLTRIKDTVDFINIKKANWMARYLTWNIGHFISLLITWLNCVIVIFWVSVTLNICYISDEILIQDSSSSLILRYLFLPFSDFVNVLCCLRHSS